jgi:small nuclear ribonucleoprotein (snRNP)-like protein
MSIFMHPIFIDLAERTARLRVVLKNDIIVTGKLQYVDANLNMQLNDAQSDSEYFPGLIKCFIRGSSVKFISMSFEDCSLELLDQLIQTKGQFI